MANESGITSPEAKMSILSELWLNYRNEEEFNDFITYNDLALPLAFAVDTGIVESNHKILSFVNECWDLLLTGMNLEDTGFESLDEMLSEE
jgi:hypothetical protein